MQTELGSLITHIDDNRHRDLYTGRIVIGSYRTRSSLRQMDLEQIKLVSHHVRMRKQ